MRIEGFRVDGFGLLHELQVQDLPPGVTVVLGPNEAGKSTLHAFLVRTLFGHPRANDARGRPRHEPLRGGRHGGAVEVRDDDGQRWSIHRYTTGSPALRVVAPSGEESTRAQALAPLLGHGMDADRFEQVFAIDLDSLAGLGALGDGALDELLLDAATVGAGRSLRAAIARLAEQRDRLWSPRARKLPLNVALSERRTAEGRLRDARQVAASYAAARREVEDLAGTLERLGAEREAVAGRGRQLELLEELWPTWQERTAAAERLQELADPGEVDAETLGASGESVGEGALSRRVEEHTEGLPVQRDRRERLREADTEVTAAEAAAEDALALLPQGWDADRVATTPTDPSLPPVVRRSVDRVRVAIQEQEAAARQYDAACRAHEGAEGAAADARAAVGAPPGRDIPDRRAAVAALRGLLFQVQHRSNTVAPPPARWPVVVAGLLTLGLVALGGVAVAVGEAAWGLASLLAAVLAAVLTVGIRRSVGAGRSSPGGGPGDGGVALGGVAVGDHNAGVVTATSASELDRQVRDAAAVLGLSPPVTLQQVEAADVATGELAAEQQRWERRQEQAEQAQAGAAQARLAAEDARAQRQRCERALEDAVGEWREVAARAGLSPDTDPEGAPELLTAVAQARRTLGELERVRTTRRRLASEIDAFDGRTLELLDAARRVCAGGPASQQPPAGEQADAVLLQLLEEWRADQAAREAIRRQRREAQEAIGRADAMLQRRLGTDERAAALAAELRTGRVTAWSEELVRVRAEERSLSEERDEVLRAHTTAQQQLAAIGTDDAVIRAATEVEQLTERCRELAEQWATLDLAVRMLASTLERFEREHQPAVLEVAGALLDRATAGRWSEVRRIDDELFVTDGGDPVPARALSRGAREQLYLCLRLALADELNRHQARLPVLIDDLMANADPRRADGLAAILAEVATRQQIVVFTCNPVTAERVQAAAPAAQLLELAAGGVGWVSPAGHAGSGAHR